MYCVGGVAMKLFTSQKVTGSNPARYNVFFFALVPVPKPGQKWGLELGQKDVCVLVCHKHM